MVFELEQIIIFIDNSNIFKGIRKYNIKADYEKLKNIITCGRELQNIFLYEGVVYPMSPEKKRLYEELTNRSGYAIKRIIRKFLKVFYPSCIINRETYYHYLFFQLLLDLHLKCFFQYNHESFDKFLLLL